MPERLADEVELDEPVLLHELPRQLPVGHDAAHLGGGVDDGLRPLLREEPAGRDLVGEVELSEVAHEDVGEALSLQGAIDGAAHQAGVAGEEDARVLADESRRGCGVGHALGYPTRPRGRL